MRRAWLLGLGLLGAASAVVVAVLLLTGGEQLERAGAASGCESGTAVPEPANNPGLVADCETLLALRDELRGTATLDWSAETSIRRWSGVLISGAPPRVTRIWLWSSSLSGRVPPGLGKLTALTSLDLHDNELSGAIPPELGSLTQLQTLHLNKNKLTGSIPAELEQLSQLQWVTLAGNTLEGCVPPKLRKVRFHDLPQLRLRDCASTPSTATPTPTATPSSLPAVTIAAAAATVTEGRSASFTVSRTGSTSAALTVALSVGETGSTLSGTPPTSVTIPAGDASVTFAVTTDDDSLDELDSVVTAAVAMGAGYTVGTSGSATVTVEDDDPATLPAVTITAVAAPVTEGQPARFTVSRTGSTTAALTVALSVSETGNTLSGEPPTSVTIPAGAASAALDVATEDDAVDEPDSVVTATVAAGSGYTVESPSSAMVTVSDDDAPAPASLRYDTYDTTGTVTKPGSYAFLAASGGTSDASRDGSEASDDSAVSLAVVTTYEDARRSATMLKINRSDANGTLRDVYYGTVKAGHIIEWHKSDDCFVRYRVTTVSPVSGGSRQFGVRPETYVFQGCQSGSLMAAGSNLSGVSANTATFSVAKEMSLAHLGGTRLSSSYAVVHGVWELYSSGGVAHETDLLVPEGSPAHVPAQFANTGTITSVTDARKFPYWREPTLPSGWRFHRLFVGGGGDLPPGYEAHFVNAAGHMALEIRGEHIVGWPVPWEATWLTNVGKRIVRELRTVANRPAVVMYSPDGTQQAKLLSVRVDIYDAATETVYIVRGADASMLGGEAALGRVLAIARSLFEGTNPR